LRVISWLTLANTHLSGVEAFAAGLRLTRVLCENFWNEVHPRVEVDGESDPYLRVNAIAAFSGSEFSGEDRIIKALRAATLLPPPLSAIFGQVEATYTQPNDAAYTAAQIDSVISDAILANDGRLGAIGAAYEDFIALKNLLSDKVEAADAPDLERLESILKPVANAIGRVRESMAGAVVEADGTVISATSGAVTQGVSGVIQSREDARRALERVCEYLEKHEPSNPASLFARRAQRMLTMSFFDIMRELTPDSLSHLEMVTGAQAPSQESSS
jgi:type VI secretion system protein ImpA